MPLNCCLVRDTGPDGKVTEWAIVTTKTVKTAQEIYDPYQEFFALVLENMDAFARNKGHVVAVLRPG